MKGFLGFLVFGLSLCGALTLWISALLGLTSFQSVIYWQVWVANLLVGLLGLSIGLYFDPFPAYLEE